METIPGARVRGSLVTRLYHADWFLAVDLMIFHILMIPTVRIVCYTAVFSVVTQRSSPLRSVA